METPKPIPLMTPEEKDEELNRILNRWQDVLNKRAFEYHDRECDRHDCPCYLAGREDGREGL